MRSSMAVNMLETCASSFSFDSLPWRRVTVRAPPSLSHHPAKPPAGKGSGPREGGLAGGYGYRDSALPSSTCRNRFILWQCCEGSLRLLEVSLDIHLVHNALQLDLEGGAGSTPLLLPDVTIHEYDSSSVVVLFATSSAVYRLILPHPAMVVKTPNLMSRGEGLMPSVLAFATEHNFIGPNMATNTDQLGSGLVVTSCASCISPTGQVTFALSSPSGAIHVIQLSPPGANSLPVRSVLRVSSMMTKLWSSLMPAAIKGTSEAEDAPVSMALHLFDGMEIVLALCKDLNLRIWSCQLSQCVMTHNMANYLQVEEDSSVKVDKLLLRKAPGGTDASVRFAVHIRMGSYSQISIFQLFLINSQLVLRPLNNYTCPMNSSLIDFSLTNREVCGVWVCRDEDGEGEETVVKKAIYDDPIPGFWQTVKLLPDPPAEVTVHQQKDPREAYLEAIFYPGRFASSAISRTLELYGANAVEEEQLPTVTTIKVEAELHASAGSQELTHDEYRDLCMQCWTKFYGCCNEYHQLLSQPVGVFQDPGTGMGLVLKKGMATFLRPDDVMIKMTFNDEYESKDLECFVKCVRDLCATVNDDVLDSFLIELGYQGHPPPITMAMDIAAALHEEGGDTGIASQLSCVDIDTVLVTLIKALDQASNDGDTSMEEDGVDYKYQTVSAQLFASPVAMTILGSALQEVCHSRMVFCRDLLILLCVLKYNSVREVPPTLSSKYIPNVSTLLLNYHTLHWLTTATPYQPTTTSYEANLKQMASLEISSHHSSRHTPGCDSTLARLYLSAGGHQDLTSELIKGRVLPTSSSTHPHWTNLVPKIIDILLTKLWPMTSSCNVSKFLLSTCQYTHLQEFLSRIPQYVTSTPFSRAFLLGHTHLSIGELEKALECFVRATGGIDDPSEPLLQCVCGSEGGDASDGGRMVQYYIKVMRLFEQVPSPSYVVRVTKIATNLVNKEHPNAAVLWSNLFKYELELGHSQGAYLAMMGNPDPVRKKDCLHRLVVVLTERKKLQELCSFTYPGMEEEVEKTIELRARSVDVTKHDYYNLLYCFHVCRSNYRKAAYTMFEYGLRLGRESPDPKSLQKQANCYAMTLTALSLTEAKYAWVVKPVEPDEPPKSSRRKRPKSSQKGSGKRKVEVLTIADLQKEYLLVKAKLRLLKKDPALATQLSSPFVSADEVTALLAQAGLFELAIDISKRFSLSMVAIFEALAARCVHLSLAVRQASGDVSVYWDWLELNQSTHIATSRENSLATKAWSLLREQLDKNPDSGTLQRCVARKLITMGTQLPQWLVDRYKTSNPAELLRMYLTFDLLEPATLLAIEFIDAVCGHGKEFFGLKNGLHTTSPSVWLPYSTLDHLHQALQSISIHSSLNELASQFNSKLEAYFQRVGEVSHTMKQSAWQAGTSYVSIGHGDRGGGGGESPTWSVTSSSGSEDNAMY